MEGLKSEILDFQVQFLINDLYSNDIENNYILNAIFIHALRKLSSSNSKLYPAIKGLINHRNCSHCKAKSLKTEKN